MSNRASLTKSRAELLHSKLFRRRACISCKLSIKRGFGLSNHNVEFQRLGSRPPPMTPAEAEHLGAGLNAAYIQWSSSFTAVKNENKKLHVHWNSTSMDFNGQRHHRYTRRTFQNVLDKLLILNKLVSELNTLKHSIRQRNVNVHNSAHWPFISFRHCRGCWASLAGLEEPALHAQEVQSASRQGGFEAAAKIGECDGGGSGSVFQSWLFKVSPKMWETPVCQSRGGNVVPSPFVALIEIQWARVGGGDSAKKRSNETGLTMRSRPRMRSPDWCLRSRPPLFIFLSRVFFKTRHTRKEEKELKRKADNWFPLASSPPPPAEHLKALRTVIISPGRKAANTLMVETPLMFVNKWRGLWRWRGGHWRGFDSPLKASQ